MTAITNAPAQDAVRYRVGDFASVRAALLQPLAGEQQLADWRPSGESDLAGQVVEWWAYLADVLTFYNERLANEAYLRTAVLPENVRRLIRMLGYRPRPGIAASGMLAALLNRPTELTLPAGLAFQSKPGPGKEPQTFEVDADTTVGPPDAVDVDPPPAGGLVTTVAGAETIVLRGTVSSVRAGDRLLLLPRTYTGTQATAYATVAAVATERDPRGRPRTRVAFAGALGLAGAQAAQYRALKSLDAAHTWPHHPAAAITNTAIHLESIQRDISAGDVVLVETPASATPPPGLVRVTATSEPVWYANAASTTPATAPPQPAIAIPIPHTEITHSSPVAAEWTANPGTVVVRHTWLDVGEPIGPPVATWTAGAGATVSAVGGAIPSLGTGRPVQIEDAVGLGVAARAAPAAGAGMKLENLPAPPPVLRAPLRALWALVPVSRGETVAREVLGSGDATRAFQEFAVAKTSLTYLPAPGTAGGYRSTLRVWVDGIEWHEAESFFEQPPDARIFVTREDDEARTHVRFGDGINGARLPTGTGNVVARYRFGSGAEAPAAGTLTVIQQPLPNLQAVRNPVPVGGGADPDPAEAIRRYAPRSVLSFGRAVSGDDYETVAAQTPGVARARVYWSFDAAAQRAGVTVYVGDDDAAVDAARAAIAAAQDPNRPLSVKKAVGIRIRVQLALRLDPGRESATVLAAVRAALVHPERGLVGRAAVGIDQTLWRSDIHAAALAVAGAVAVHALTVSADRGTGLKPEAGPRYQPGEGKFFALDPADLTVTQEGA